MLLAVILGVMAGCGKSAEREAEQAYQQGLVAKAEGRFPQALEAFQAAVEREPQHAGAQLELGMLLCRYGEHGACIRHLLKAHELAPRAAKAVAYLGYAYQQRRNWQVAEAYYGRALELAPNLTDVYQYLADVLQQQGKLEQAARALEALAARFPEYDDLSVIQARIGTLRQPENLDAYEQLADAHVTRGDITQGLRAYRRAHPDIADNAALLAQFGIFCAQRQAREAAVAYLRQAIEQGRDGDGDAWWWLATVQDDLGNAALAIDAYRQVLTLQPEHADARQRLVALLEDCGRSAEAADVLERDLSAGRIRDVNAAWQRILRLRGEDAGKAVVELRPAGADEFLLEVEVDAAQTATFLLDPQSEYTIISEALAERLNILLSANTSVVHFSYRGQRYTPYLVNLPSVAVGGLAVRNVKTLILDLSDVVPPIDGVLGENFLRHFDVQIEREQHWLILTTS